MTPSKDESVAEGAVIAMLCVGVIVGIILIFCQFSGIPVR